MGFRFVVSGRATRRLIGIAIGLALDSMLGEPPNRLHPIVGMGKALSALERRSYRDHHLAGAAHLVIAASAAWLFGREVERRLGDVIGTAASVWLVSAGAMLRREATIVAQHLRADEVGEARQRLQGLVGRDTDELDEAQIVRAVIESVAENTVDAVTSPIFWAQICGPPGAWTHRVVNTLDAMVGNRDLRYVRFGWASARADDALNFAPARLTAVAAAAVGPVSAGRVLRTVRRDAPQHPSPNGGQIESATAAALGISLGGVNRYGDRVEDRGLLGDGPPPRRRDIDRANRLMTRSIALVVAMVGAAGALATGHGLRRQCASRE